MTKELPKITIEGITYFLDERLNEMRNVNNPHDTESMEGMSAEYWQELFNE